MSFSKIDLSEERIDILSGKETNKDGIHYYKCEPGSIGRFIKNAQKERFRYVPDYVTY